MDKRFFTFIILAMAILMGHQLLMNKFFPPPPKPVAQKPADAKKPDDPQKPAATNDAAKKDAEKPAAEPNKPAADPANPAEDIAPAWTTLGSLDDDGPFRLLVTFTNKGAAVERVELSNHRYHEVDNIHPVAAYLGHFAAEPVIEGEGEKAKPIGCKVNVVGPGTPAALAGIEKGDVVLAVAGQPTPTPAQLDRVLAVVDPLSSVKVKVRRAGGEREFDVALRRAPLQLIKPEFSDPATPAKPDPFSFLLTVQEAAGRLLGVEERELKDVALLEGNWELLPTDAAQPNTAAFRRTVPELNVEITKRYSLNARDPNARQDQASDYTLNLRVEMKNLSEKASNLAYRLSGPTGLPVEGAWYARDSKIGLVSGCGMRDVIYGQFNGRYVDNGMTTCAEIVDAGLDDKAPTHLTAMPISYVGVDGMYFTAVIVPQKADPAEHRFSRIVPEQVGTTPKESYRKRETDVSFRMTRAPLEIAAGQSLTDDFKIYLGPKVPAMLAEYGLAGQIDYGWYDWIAEPMLFLLHTFYGWVGNYGIAIMMLTVCVRSLMFPLSRKQALNAVKMQQLQPEIKKLAERYKGKREEQARAQQELFKKHNYNPFAGCLPVFVQIPIFVGLYNSLKVDVELRQAPLISENIRWASNLSAPDMFWFWQPYLHKLPLVGEMFFGDNGWLGPFLNLLPCVTIALFLIQNKMFMPPPTDEQTAMQQKMIKYMMVFMGVMFFKVPAGLCVYFITSSVWSICERKLLPKIEHIKEPASEAVIDVTPAKPGEGAKKRNKR